MKANNVKKLTALALALTLAVGCTAGCGKKESNSDKIEIAIGNWPAKEGPELDSSNERKANFEKENPDIKINPDTWTWDLQTFYPKAAAGLLPNLYTTPFSEVSKLMDNEYLADLTEVLKEGEYTDKFDKKVLSVISKDGKIMAFPQTAYTMGLTYNVSLFKKAGLMEADGTPKQPKDWDELTEMAVQIKEKTGKPGLVLMTAENTGGWIFTNIAWSFGVNFMEQGKDGKWKATFNSDEMADALQWVKDLKWKYDVLPSNTIVNAGEGDKLFATGNAAMTVMHPTTSRYAVYDMKPDDYGYMAIPAGPKKWVTLLGGNVYGFSNKTTPEQQKAILKWLEYSGSGLTLDDTRKEAIRKSIEFNLEKGYLVGHRTMSVFNENAEVVKYRNEVTEELANSNINYVRLYNESLTNPKLEVQTEEPVCAQDLYGILDNLLQEVLNNKDADVKSLIKKANSDFQRNYLDKIDY